jgi:hypothetical protein
VCEAFESHKFRLNLAELLKEWAEVHLKRGEPGDCDRARELLSRSLGMYTDMGIPYFDEKVAARLDQL